MIVSDSWIKSIFVVTIVLTVLRPTTAGLGDFLGSIATSVVNTCHNTPCESHPRCPAGFDTLSTSREGCSGFKEKSYCCPAGLGPQCYFTQCGREASCPGNYRELDRTKSGCSSFDKKVYCCKTTNLPYCFDLSCPAFAESKKSCPPEYKESKRAKGRSAGCDSAFAERITCCLNSGNSGNSGGTGGTNLFHNSNTNNNTEVISQTKTETLEDGSVRTVTTTQTRSKSTGGWFGFGSAESSFASFFKILLILPVLIAIL